MIPSLQNILSTILILSKVTHAFAFVHPVSSSSPSFRTLTRSFEYHDDVKKTSLNLIQHHNTPTSVSSSLYHAHVQNLHTATSLESSFSPSNDILNNEQEMDDDETTKTNKKSNIISKILSFFKPKSSEKMSTKDMLKKMGLSMLLSYGFVSNVTSVILTSLAWFTSCKRTGLSPLAPGQWKGFLAVYAGFYVFANLIRPLRMGLAVGISKYFDDGINIIQNKFKCSRAVSIGMLVFLTNIVGTFTVMFLGISSASILSGVPIFPPKVIVL